MASSRIFCTYFTTGASSMSSVTTSGWTSPSVISMPERSTSSVAASRVFADESVSFFTIAESLSSSTTTGSMVMPVANFTSCRTCSLEGSDIATKMRLPRLPSAITRWFANTSLAEIFFEATSCWMNDTPAVLASDWMAFASAWTSLPCWTRARPRALK